jgi:hypothetical protein
VHHAREEKRLQPLPFELLPRAEHQRRGESRPLGTDVSPEMRIAAVAERVQHSPRMERRPWVKHRHRVGMTGPQAAQLALAPIAGGEVELAGIERRLGTLIFGLDAQPVSRANVRQMAFHGQPRLARDRPPLAAVAHGDDPHVALREIAALEKRQRGGGGRRPPARVLQSHGLQADRPRRRIGGAAEIVDGEDAPVQMMPRRPQPRGGRKKKHRREAGRPQSPNEEPRRQRGRRREPPHFHRRRPIPIRGDSHRERDRQRHQRLVRRTGLLCIALNRARHGELATESRGSPDPRNWEDRAYGTFSPRPRPS